MKTGITGLEYSGKTTLFCSLTGQEYGKLSHGKDIHIGTVKVPDPRLDVLFDFFKPMKKTFAVMEYFDVAGQSSGESKGMDTAVLQTLKNADSLIVVLGCFGEDAHPEENYDTVMQDFALNDLIIISGRLERIAKEMHAGKSSNLIQEQNVLEKCRATLENGGMLKEVTFNDEEEKLLRGFRLLTMKPVVAVLNITEKDLQSGSSGEKEKTFTALRHVPCAAICAEVEMEIASLDENDRAVFLESMGIIEPALGRMIRLSYESLGLMSFFTAGGTDEVRAWTVCKGAKAPECAGAIHSDLERGFIRAETIAFEDLIKVGSLKTAKEKGLLRIEGKDYIVQDGDILTIRFSV